MSFSFTYFLQKTIFPVPHLSDLTLPDGGRGVAAVSAVGVLCAVAGVVVFSSKLLVHISTVNHYFKQIVNFLCLLLLCL